jgi:predicted alternative tryptophan synthase beta-subunit
MKSTSRGQLLHEFEYLKNKILLDNIDKFEVIYNKLEKLNKILSLDLLSDSKSYSCSGDGNNCTIKYSFCNDKYHIEANTQLLYVKSDICNMMYTFEYNCDIDDLSMIVSAFNILFDDTNDKYANF